MKKITVILTALSTILAISLNSVSAMHGQDAEAGNHRAMNKFKKMDANGDQKVTKAEAMEYAENKFAKIDANNDGNISLEEMMSHKAGKQCPQASTETTAK